MSEPSDQSLDQAINRLSEADPLCKLLNEVRLGRMKPTDTGLRAVTESWLHIYHQVLEAVRHLDKTALRRLDPSPRLDVLIRAQVLRHDHPAVQSLHMAFAQIMTGRAGLRR